MDLVRPWTGGLAGVDLSLTEGTGLAGAEYGGTALFLSRTETHR